MNIKRYIVSIIISLLILASSSDAKEYVDVDVLDGTSFSISESHNKYISGDIADSVVFCEADDDFLCLVNDFFTFAVPKENIDTKKSWIYKNTKFFKKRSRVFKVLGEEVSVYEIESEFKDLISTFFFSKGRGLVVVDFKNTKDSGLAKTYWNESGNGFWASEN